jgi:hypothetical protein
MAFTHSLMPQLALNMSRATNYLTLRSISSLSNPQNSEMNFYEKYEVDMLEIIIIIMGYTLNNFIFV